MQHFFILTFKAFRRGIFIISSTASQYLCKILFYGQNVKCKSFNTIGLPYVSVALGGTCTIGSSFTMNNKLSANPIGPTQPCIIFVNKNAELRIGNNVGISQAAIVCHQSITIGNDVKIGGGVCIYDTDFHSLDPEIRKVTDLDFKNKINRSVLIKNNAFIGAHSIILKGVVVGENSVVGACSVVTKNIPDNEIWAGNPAKRIKAISKLNIPLEKIG